MLKNSTCFLILLFVSFSLYGQNTHDEIDEMLLEVKQLDGDPKKAIEILSQAKKSSEKIGYIKGFVESGITLSLFYSRENDYEKVIRTCDEIEKEAEKLGNNLILSDLNRMRSLAYANQGFTDLSYEGFKNALKYARKIDVKDKRHYKLSLVYENLTIYYDHLKFPVDTLTYYLGLSLDEAMKIDDTSKDVPIHYKYDMIGMLYLNLGLLNMDYGEEKKMDVAEQYFMKALELYDHEEYGMFEVNKVGLLTYTGKFYYTQKEYLKAVHYLNESIKLEKRVKTPYVRKEAYELLSKSYLELDSTNASKKYLKLFTALNDSMNVVNTLESGKSLNKIVSKNESIHKSNLKKLTLLSLVGVGISSLMVWLFWRMKRNKMRNSYELLIERLENEKKNLVEKPSEINADVEVLESNISQTGISISDSTQEDILEKLAKFEKNQQYLKKEITLTYLAGKWNTNTNYLSQTIRQHKGKSFNNYLNELRINHIVNLLYGEAKYRDYKISYLAELTGFSSREVFTRAFKKETGFSPLFYIENLNAESDAKKDNKNDRNL